MKKKTLVHKPNSIIEYPMHANAIIKCVYKYYMYMPQHRRITKCDVGVKRLKCTLNSGNVN